MFSESYVYKNELLKYAKDLLRRKYQKKWFNESYLIIEKEIFFGFFIIRKLYESLKISSSLKNKAYIVGKIYYEIPFNLNYFNIYKILDYINLNKEKTDRISIKKICNQFIHSYYLFILHDKEGSNVRVLLSSDYSKSKECLIVNIDTIASIFKEFGKNYPKKIESKHNKKTGEVTFKIK